LFLTGFPLKFDKWFTASFSSFALRGSSSHIHPVSSWPEQQHHPQGCPERQLTTRVAVDVFLPSSAVLYFKFTHTLCMNTYEEVVAGLRNMIEA
jgi:hypothetical protein